MNKNNRFIFDAICIFVSYFYFGILQEKITKGKYLLETTDVNGDKNVINEKYTYVLSLVFVQCLMNWLFASLVLKIWPKNEDRTPTFYYASVSLTYLLAMVCSNMALQWVPYPTQVVAKSAKPIPVMLLGVLLGNKSYTMKKYVFVLLIVIGVVLFMFKENATQTQQEFSLGIGELLLGLSLLMDGLTGAVQERIRGDAKPSGQQMMRTSNAWSCIYLAVALLATGESWRFIEFVQRHPSVILNLIMMAITQAFGQLCIYSMVYEFGPLVVSVVTTTRKFFTVLASVILFGNVLTGRQWSGAMIVFSALFLDAFYAKRAPKKT